MKYFALHVHCIIVSVALNLETRVNYGRNKLQSFRKPTRLRFVRKSHLNQTDNIGNVQATDKATDDISSDSWQDEREPPVLFLWKMNETHIRCPAQTLLQVKTKMIRQMMLLVRTLTGWQGKE